jgi:hypothetical protein
MLHGLMMVGIPTLPSIKSSVRLLVRRVVPRVGCRPNPSIGSNPSVLAGEGFAATSPRGMKVMLAPLNVFVPMVNVSPARFVLRSTPEKFVAIDVFTGAKATLWINNDFPKGMRFVELMFVEDPSNE